jgi:hypothetical protein
MAARLADEQGCPKCFKLLAMIKQELSSINYESVVSVVRLAWTVYVTIEWSDRGDNDVHHGKRRQAGLIQHTISVSQEHNAEL